MSLFKEYIGIDYSGAGGPDSRCKGLRVYSSTAANEATEVPSPDASRAQRRNWTRRGLAQWLLSRCQSGKPLIIGIDHAFSFPISYLARRRAASWAGFLDDFCENWPTDKETVEECRAENPCSGQPTEFRLTEKWTSSAKSVFRFDGQGSVAKSTHSGLPWLRWMRSGAGETVHFWPFDGWSVPGGRSVIAEVYPSIFRNRFPRGARNGDQQDAFATAEWLRTRDGLGYLAPYLAPQLSEDERRIAGLEGWILGVA